MKGADIKYLAGVADLARLDFEAADVTVRGKGDSVSAQYNGGYSGGWRSVKTDAGQFEIAVHAKRFKEIVSLFDDDGDVALSANDHELVLRSASSTVQLQRRTNEIRPESDVVPDDPAALNPLIAFRIPYKVLLEEVDIATNYVSDNNLRPVLTGLRFDVDENRLTITAFDGFQMLFKSMLEVRTRGKGTFVVPAADFLLGMRLINAEGDALFLRLSHKDKILIYNQQPTTAYFDVSILNGTWPNMDKVENMEISGAAMSLTPGQLRTLAIGGRAFESHQVSLSGNNGHAAFNIQSENGLFSSAVESAPINGTLHYDLDGFSKMGKLGDKIDLIIPPLPEIPTVATAGHRRCWIMSRG